MTTFSDPSSPAIKAASVTKSDSIVFAPPTKGLYIGVTGDVAVLMAEDVSPVTFVAVASGTVLPLRAAKVMSTNTTAASIVALF